MHYQVQDYQSDFLKFDKETISTLLNSINSSDNIEFDLIISRTEKGIYKDIEYDKVVWFQKDFRGTFALYRERAVDDIDDQPFMDYIECNL